MAPQGEWITRGFEAFRRGSFGNAGQNLFVSRAGVLQRIHLFDLNRDGYVDLVFCNSQEHWESPPAYIYPDPLNNPRERIELWSDGAATGAVADLNGDGYDDLVLGMERNGARSDLNAVIYYGSPTGLSYRYHTEIPAPLCTSVAAGDLNGDGRADLALICEGRVRIFYQTELGFEPKRFCDLKAEATQLAVGDLDGDDFADLCLLGEGGGCCVYWGGADGISPERFSKCGVRGEGEVEEEMAQVSEEERKGAISPLARIVLLGDVPHLFLPSINCSFLVPVRGDRSFGEPLVFQCPHAFAVAAGDVNGDGYLDIVFAARDRSKGAEYSWVYWGGPDGFHETNRTGLPSVQACDVAVGDIDGDGCAEIVLCQHKSETSFTFWSPLFRGTRAGVNLDAVPLQSEGARRVFIARPWDGPPQVIFVNQYSRGALGDARPVIYFGGRDGFSPTRRAELSGIGAASALCCDVNDDGYPDLIIANSAENATDRDPGSFVFLGGPEGFSREPDLVIPTKRAWGIAVADLNRDGYLDLVVCSYQSPDLLIFYGTLGGFNLAHPQRIHMECDGVVYDEPRRLLLADLNNDGWLDLVVSQVKEDRCFILWGGPDGFNFERRQMLSVLRGSCPQAADLTGNGYLDLVIGGHKPDPRSPHESFIYIYWNGPEGIRGDRRTQLPANTVLCMAIADFNNDGHLDIFAGSYHDGKARDIDSYIYWGGPEGDFSISRCTPLRTHSVSGCMAADFDEDGWIDLAVCNHKTCGDHKGDSFVLWNGPLGFDLRNLTRLPTIGAHGMVPVQPGNQRDRGPEEYYVSEAFELPPGMRVERIDWQAELPPKTWVHAQLRTAHSRETLESAEWHGPRGPNSWFERGDSVRTLPHLGRWVQYRLALGSVNSGNTPRVHEVRVSYA